MANKPQKAWNVYRLQTSETNPGTRYFDRIDTVYFDRDMHFMQVKRSLIDHDGLFGVYVVESHNG